MISQGKDFKVYHIFFRMVMIGDRPDTDMLLAHNGGVDGCLVFTGVVSGLREL
jgi:ribonucleotide monophosphatase NagD (HAD superfamily)